MTIALGMVPALSAEVGRKENGAVVEFTTHVESRVNPKAGDFLWELEGKPEPKYIWHERDTNAVTQPVSFPRKRESME